MGFKGNVFSFEPVTDAYKRLLINAKKIETEFHGMSSKNVD